MTDSHAESHGQPAGSVEWDAVYDAAAQVWSGNPNGVLVAEVSGLAPGTVLDVGCGEGADAVWLAQRGWQVTAIDVAATALARAAERAEAAGVGVRFVHAGLLEFSSSGGRFDLVNVQYPGLLHEDGRALAALLDLVAPGGTLLFVHHADLVGEHGDGHHDGAGPAGVDPADYLLPADVLSGLGDGWIVEVFEQRPRRVTEGAGAGHTVDLVLRARRTAAEPAMEAG
jgi:SAM-dependent methyltransferase